jgi:hypothetical protein
LCVALISSLPATFCTALSGPLERPPSSWRSKAVASATFGDFGGG